MPRSRRALLFALLLALPLACDRGGSVKADDGKANDSKSDGGEPGDGDAKANDGEADDGEPDNGGGDTGGHPIGEATGQAGEATGQPTVDAVELTAPDLIAKFHADRAAWLGKPVVVSGVFKFGTMGPKTANFKVAGSVDDKDVVLCQYANASIDHASDTTKIDALASGDAVKVQGTVREFVSQPLLEACVLAP